MLSSSCVQKIRVKRNESGRQRLRAILYVQFKKRRGSYKRLILSPAKAGWEIKISLIRGWRASHLPPATIFHSYAVKNESLLERLLHLRPFIINDAEQNRIADAATRQDQMFAQDAFLLCSQTQNRPRRLFVEHIGDQFNSHAFPCFKCLSQQQQLGFGVDGRALCAFSQPGVADGGNPIVRSNFVEAGGANDLIR